MLIEPIDVFHPISNIIFQMIRGHNRKILDVGCSTGRLGERLRIDKGCFMVGIDADKVRTNVGIESSASALVRGQPNNGRYDQVREIFYTRGAAMAIWRDVFFSAGIFDPAYFIDHDEIDLCWRIRLMGYKIAFAPHSRVYHYGGGLVGRREENPLVLFHLRKNNIMSLSKNYELKNIVKYLSMYLMFLLIHGLYSGLRERPTYCLPT